MKKIVIALTRNMLMLIGIMTLLVTMCGCKDQPVPYRQEDHGSFNDEFPPHVSTNGWWYITGYLKDISSPEELYAFQFTQVDLRGITGVAIYGLQLAVTNLQTGEHLFEYHFSPADMLVYADNTIVSFQPWSLLKRDNAGMDILGRMEKASLRLRLDLGKGAFWHGDNGVLVMGLPDDPVQRTVYYSYTNMPTTGELSFIDDSGGETVLTVEGKSWFDRQWGPYRMLDARSSFWEWFSLRFFDNEEVMLFAFPQQSYQDGTYITENGVSQRLLNYTYEPTDYVKVEDTCFSSGWDLTMPGIKQTHYRIEPIIDGQFHLNYFELLATVINDSNEIVGYAFVELLPDIRQGMCD